MATSASGGPNEKALLIADYWFLIEHAGGESLGFQSTIKNQQSARR
jgi:hypothetical protein